LENNLILDKSKADFISKINIALKEADETAYWLELLIESGIVQENQVHDLYEANIELIKIMTAIIKTSKKGGKIN
jgi:four helix bundle protein